MLAVKQTDPEIYVHTVILQIVKKSDIILKSMGMFSLPDERIVSPFNASKEPHKTTSLVNKVLPITRRRCW